MHLWPNPYESKVDLALKTDYLSLFYQRLWGYFQPIRI